jgi:peptidoglycan/LPS O-acetylase OafA/YrhL
MTIGDLDSGKNNNFNLLRHVAAALVIVTHSYGLTSTDNLFNQLTGHSAGHIAVNIFFALSGYLITSSWIRKPDFKRYVANRAARIYPALWMSIFFCVLVIGPMDTTLPLRDYFLHRDSLAFTVANSTLIQGTFLKLPGVFSGKPVNESLWTLPYEMRMYVAVLVFGVTQLISCRGVVAACYALLVFVEVAGNIFGVIDIGQNEWIRLGSYFAAGSTYCLYRGKIPVSGVVAALMTALVVFGYSQSQSVGTSLLTIFLPYVIFFLVYVPKGPILMFNRIGDYSYGLYIYAFPIQQLLVISGFREVHVHLLLSYSLTLLVAAISWHLVESPVLKWAKFL